MDSTCLGSMFYSFPSDRTKIGGVSLIRNIAIGSQQILKQGSTSAGHNSALIPPTPLCHTYFEPWTWGLTRYHLIWPIAIQKINQIAIEWSVYWAFFGDFLGREPRLFSKISYFQKMSVLSDFLCIKLLCMLKIYIILAVMNLVYHSMTTLKFGGFWFWTGTIS